ncbi:DMT family transporter [Akkermansiaceae bacterium]|nr:DMT family transporter [Akkermansiaceae bacterium]MDB4537902.1 DMT family transporter [Akkermansiaceae bacterium]
MPLFRRPLLPALICALLWGSAFPAIKHVYEFWEHHGLIRTLPLIFLFAGVRFTIAGGGLLIFGKNLRRELRATPWKSLAALALTQTFIQYVFFYQAVAVSSASLTALLVATGSFWWMILAPLIQKTPWPMQRQWLGLVIGGLGVSLAVYAPGAGAGNPLLGALFMLTATASGALAVITFQKIKPTMSAINATGLSLFFGGLGLSVIGSSALPELSQMFAAPVILATLWLAFVSAAAFSMWNHLTTMFPVTLLASYRFLIPICGVVEALIFVSSESAGWGLFVGGSLVITSMIMAQRQSQ